MSLAIVGGALAYRLLHDPHATETVFPLGSAATTSDVGEIPTGQELRIASAAVVLQADPVGSHEGRSTGALRQPIRPAGDPGHSPQPAGAPVGNNTTSSSSTTSSPSTMAAASSTVAPTVGPTQGGATSTNESITPAPTTSSTQGSATSSNESTTPAPTTVPMPAGPMAVDDAATGSEGKGLKIKVLGNDTEGAAELDVDTLTIESGPGHADDYRVHDDHIHYKSVDDYSGTDRLRYRICDENGLCATATLVLTIEE